MNDRPVRILVVEDDADQAALLRAVLEAGGYSVDVVPGGAAALDACEVERPDLVFMDIGLEGGMDGIYAADLVRRRAGLPVVFLTGATDDATLARAREAEPYGYLVKPVDMRHLKPMVEMAIHKHRGDVERKRLEKELAEARAEIERLKRAGG